MGKYKASDYTRRGKHGRGQAGKSYPPLRINFDGRAVNRDYSKKYKKRDPGYLKRCIYKRKSRRSLVPSALWTPKNRRKRHSSHSHNREQGSSSKRIRNSSPSPRRVSPEKIPDIYSDISEYDLESNPGEISDRSDQNSTINENYENSGRRKAYSQWQTSAHGQENEIVGGQTDYSRTSNSDTEHTRFDDMYPSLSSDTHDVRSPQTGVYTENIFSLPITFQSFKAFSCHEKTEFKATAIAELVALKTENDEYLFGVEMSDFKDRLHSRGIQFQSHKSFMEVMSSLRANFDITHDNMIKPRTNVKICERYTQNPMLKECDCHDLHSCKFFLVGRCPSDKSCKFSHDIFQPHNKDVLERHFLHKMNPKHIGEIVSYIHNRNATTSPTVCKFYNNEGGCKQLQQHCQHLHVCLHFVTRTCKFGASCMRDHNFHSDQSKLILRKYGLSEYEYNHEVLFDLIGKNLNNGVIKTRKSLDKIFETNKDKGVDSPPSTSRNTQEVVVKVDGSLDTRLENIQPKPSGLDGHANYGKKTPLLQPSGGDGFEEHKKQSISTVGHDNYCQEKSKLTSEDTKPDGKITFQRNPNNDGASIEQDVSIESAEEGEIIEDTHTQCSQVPDSYRFSHLQGETKNETIATMILTNGTTCVDSERQQENSDKNKLNFIKEPCIQVEASIRNIHLSDVHLPPFGSQDVCQPKKLSEQCSSKHLQQTNTSNHKTNGVAASGKTYKISLEGNTVDISVLGKTDKPMLNDDIKNKVKSVVTSLIELRQLLDGTSSRPTDQVVNDGRHNVDN